MEITENNENLINALQGGVYAGKSKFLSKFSNNQNISLEHEYKSALSIGLNPFFKGEKKTIEVFLIDYKGDNFYSEILEVSISNYIRSESNFESFGELVTAITYDIVCANELTNR